MKTDEGILGDILYEQALELLQLLLDRTNSDVDPNCFTMEDVKTLGYGEEHLVVMRACGWAEEVNPGDDKSPATFMVTVKGGVAYYSSASGGDGRDRDGGGEGGR